MTAPRLLVNAAWPSDPRGAPYRSVALAQDSTADGIGFPDSPRLFADPFVETQRALDATSTALAGPCVLGLGLRHPATVGAALRTLVERHGKRVFGVLGRGESGVRNEGLAVPSFATYLSALESVCDVLGPSAGRMTLLGAASGPRTLAASAVRTHGVLVDVGVDPDMVADAIAAARQESPDSRCWVFVRAVITSSMADAMTCTAPLIGSCADRMTASPDWYHVPRGARHELAQIAASHDYSAHGRATGIADSAGHALVRDRFFLTGEPAAISDRVSALASLGIDGLVLAGATSGLVPRLRDTVAALRRGLTPVPEQP